jgi:uncharacterized protein YkwD
MPALHNVISRGLVALAVGAAGAISVATAAPAQAVTTTYLNSYEVRVVQAVNAQRAAHGLRALSYRSCPDRYAESLATKLRTSSTIYHQSMGSVLNGCSATRASENIARARTSASGVVRMWMNSSGHRANILDPRVTQIGVGTTCSSMCTTVADFIRP